MRELSEDSVHRRSSAYCKQFRWLGAGRCAGRTDDREIDGKKNGVRWKFQQVDEVLCREERRAIIERPGRVMLNPLAEVGVGVLVPIVVSRRQLVMDILRHGKRRNGEQ